MTLRSAISTSLPALAAIGALAFAMPATAGSETTRADRGQERLDKLLKDRIAGEPTNCVFNRPSGRLYIIDETALVYESGSTVYVNYTKHPESLDDGDYLVLNNPGTQLCRTTQITTRRRGGNFFSGVVFLDDFIPYKKVKDEG